MLSEKKPGNVRLAVAAEEMTSEETELVAERGVEVAGADSARAADGSACVSGLRPDVQAASKKQIRNHGRESGRFGMKVNRTELAPRVKGKPDQTPLLARQSSTAPIV